VVQDELIRQAIARERRTTAMVTHPLSTPDHAEGPHATESAAPIPAPLPAHLTEHPAARAWRRVSSTSVTPKRIEALKETPESRIYRLVGAGPGGSSVIAKQGERERLAGDRLVYVRIHPRLDMRTLECYGFDEPEGSEFCTLFLEDAGDGPYLVDNPAHRVLAGRWLAALHTGALGASLAASSGELAHRGPAHYLAELRTGRRLIEHILPTWSAATKTLAEVVACLDRAERSWPILEEIVATAPTTLVHGDLKPKNLRVLATEGGAPWLAVFDWETVGWGPPAVDLAYSPLGRDGLAASPDLDAYAQGVVRVWPELDRAMVDRLALVGTFFRTAVAVSWAAMSLEPSGGERPLSKLVLYAETLTRLLDEAGWAR
jgi:hypothetical protein